MPVTLPSATHPGHLCYVRATWAASWVETPLLRATQIHSQAAPAHATAQLSYRYGAGIQPELGSRPADSVATAVSRASLAGYYVKISIPGLGDWFGILVDTTDDRKGDLNGTTPSGTEQYVAYGLTLLLERSAPVRETVVKVSSGVSKTIGIAIPVNGGSDGRQGGQRVGSANQDETDNVFSDPTKTASLTPWTANDFGSYLLEHFPPTDASGTEKVTFLLNGGTALDYELPFLDYSGQTVWDIIKRLIPRQRGLGFDAYVNGSDEIVLNVWTHSAAAIPVPSGGTIPANPNTATYNLGSAVNIRSATVTTSAIHHYDQIHVIGSRRGSVFTVDSTIMDQDWSESELDDYNAARSAESDFASLSDEEKSKRNADYRSQDHLSGVFSWWRLPEDWDGLAGSDKVFVAIDTDGNPDPTADSEPYWVPELRLQPFIPLRQGLDYSGTITPATSTADDQQKDFLKLPVWFDLVHAERLDAAADFDDEAPTWSVQTKLREDWPGLILEVQGGAQQYIADDLFVANGSYEETPGEQGAYDVDEWKATIYVMQQQHVEARFPADADVTSGDVARIKLIRVPDAYLDYLVPNTVVGIEHAGDGSSSYQTTSGGWLRDDRDRLRDIARLAWEWYGTPRKTVNISFKALTAGFSVGTLITGLITPSGTESINTVITSVEHDIANGTTTLQTQYEELDFVGLA